VLRELLSTFIHTLMGAEADALCGAGYGERSGERTNHRNGYRHREFDTRTGSLDLAIPKLRQGSYFPDWLLERRKRAERALTTVVANCYLLGVSTRRMDKLVETLGITSLSKSQVSVMANSTPRWRRSGPGRWTPARTRSSLPTPWCSRSASRDGWSTCTR
jgi:putative transposase